MEWFGTYWPSPLTYFGEQAATPIGNRCRVCGREILDGDSGVVVDAPFEDQGFDTEPVEDHRTVLRRWRDKRQSQLAFHRRCFADLLLKVDGQVS